VKAVARCALLIFIIGGLGGRAYGDGKFFVGEKVPADIPYQRAFILFNGGSETLVLQSKYELSQSASVDSLGWVVPVPTVPAVASADAETTKMFFFFASLRTRPKVTRISSIFLPIIAIFFLGSVAFLLLCLVEYPFINKIGLSKAAWRCRLWKGLIIAFFAFILAILTPYHLGLSLDVEIVKAEKVGIYDVKVIRSESAEAVLGWLRENGYGFSDTDKKVFEEYIGREWCFVVAKVEPEPETEKHKIVSEGLVAPLILKFETETAVYPLALTSTIGAETEILLYTFSENKLSCDERLTLRSARKKVSTSFMLDLLSRAEPETSELFVDVPKFMYLCKFKKKLKPEEMKKDLEFEFAPDNEPYKETKLVW